MLENNKFGCMFVIKVGECESKQAPILIPLTFINGALVPSPTVCAVVKEKRIFPLNLFQLEFNYSIFECGQIPIADFVADKINGTIPLQIQFTDLSDNVPTSWFWDFGDDSTSTNQNPIHIYSVAGRYTVILNVINNKGEDTITKINYITASNPITTPNNINITSIDGSNLVTFEGNIGFTNRYSFWTITNEIPTIIGDWITFSGDNFSFFITPNDTVYLYIEVSDNESNWSEPGILNIETSTVSINSISTTPNTLMIDVIGSFNGLLTSFQWYYSSDNFVTSNQISNLNSLNGSIVVPAGTWWVKLIGHFASGSVREVIAGSIVVS